MMSASAWMPIRARKALNGSPAVEKIGIFWLSTRQLKTSIIGTSVRIIFEASTRLAGLAEGPPMAILGSWSRSGPPSIGRPVPPKTRPRMLAEQVTSGGWPKKRTVAWVESPLVPEKTWSEATSAVEADHLGEPLLLCIIADHRQITEARLVVGLPVPLGQRHLEDVADDGEHIGVADDARAQAMHLFGTTFP